MRRTSIIAAAIGGLLVSSSAFAGFTVSHTVTSIDANLDRVDIFARNTGGDTGTGLLAVEIFGTNVVGQSLWNSPASGAWRPTNSSEIENRSFVRIDATDPGSSSIVSKEPAANQPLAAQFGPSTVALGNFGVVLASLTGPAPAETGNGALFAQLIVTKNYSATMTGNVGGSAGSKVPFSFVIGGTTPPTVPPVIVNNNASTNVVFGQIVTNGAPFSIQIQATDADAGDVLALALGALPSGISNVSVAPATSGSPANFTVSGLVDYSLNGTTVNVPFTVNSTSGSASGQFSIVVTPEPTSLAALGLSSLFLGRRRK